MSIVSNIHTATIYDAKKSAPFDGQRLVKTIAKADAKGNYGPHLQQTMCTSIPVLTADQLVDALNDDALQVRLLPHLVEYLHGVQSDLIGSRIKTGQRDITTGQLSIEGLCNYLESETVADKWTAERITQWFTDTIAEYIGVALLEKGWNEEKMQASLVAHCKLFSDTLAATKTAIPHQKAVAMQKAMNLVPESERVGVWSKFEARVEKALEVTTLVDALGL